MNIAICYLHACVLQLFTQIDLIDMRHLLHGENKWILHCIDHWSKFNFAYALPRKSAVNVAAAALNSHLFPFFGAPRILHTILHSDNGREIVNSVIGSLLAIWHSEIQLVSGHLRHAQSQGSVKRAHLTLQQKLVMDHLAAQANL